MQRVECLYDGKTMAGMIQFWSRHGLFVKAFGWEGNRFVLHLASF